VLDQCLATTNEFGRNHHQCTGNGADGRGNDEHRASTQTIGETQASQHHRVETRAENTDQRAKHQIQGQEVKDFFRRGKARQPQLKLGRELRLHTEHLVIDKLGTDACQNNCVQGDESVVEAAAHLLGHEQNGAQRSAERDTQPGGSTGGQQRVHRIAIGLRLLADQPADAAA